MSPGELSQLKRKIAQGNLIAYTEYLGYLNNGSFHVEWYNYLQNRFSPLKFYPDRDKRAIQLWPRGHAKTEATTINYTSWLIGNYPDIHINIVTKTASLSEEILTAIMTRLESDERYIEVFGNLKPKDPKKWTTNKLIVNRREISKSPTLKATGLMGAITGGRSDLIILDDVEDEENVRTELQRQKVETWVNKVLHPTLYPWGGMIVIGTRWHYADFYQTLLNSPDWTKSVKTAILLDSKGNETDQILWPEYWTLKKLQERRKEIGSIYFQTQYMNNPTSMQGDLLKAEWLHPWNEKDPNFTPPVTLPVYAGIDPSLGESDYFGVASFAYDPVNRQGYLLDVWAEHMPFPTIAHVKFPQLVNTYNYRKIYMESNFWQKLLQKMPEFQTHPQTGKPYPIVPIQTVKDKEARLIPMSSHFESKRVLVNPLLLSGKSEFFNQWVQFPRGEHDDALDCVEFVVSNVLSTGQQSQNNGCAFPRVEQKRTVEETLSLMS